MFFHRDWKNGPARDVLGITEPVPATWFREGVVGIRRLTRSHDGARKGAVVAFTCLLERVPEPRGTPEAVAGSALRILVSSSSSEAR